MSRAARKWLVAAVELRRPFIYHHMYSGEWIVHRIAIQPTVKRGQKR